MVASEFAFLALGLIVGIPIGMALLLRIRARPAAGREVRLTVTPDSVPRRRSATLATDPISTDGGSARGGPADTAWYSDQAAPRTPVPTRRLPSVASPPPPMVMASPGEPPARDVAQRPIFRTPVRSSVGVSVGRGVDPILAAIQSGPTGELVAAAVPLAAPAAVAERTVEATSLDRLRTVLADDSSRRRAATDDRRVTAVEERTARMRSVAIAAERSGGRPGDPLATAGVGEPTERGGAMAPAGGA